LGKCGGWKRGKIRVNDCAEQKRKSADRRNQTGLREGKCNRKKRTVSRRRNCKEDGAHGEKFAGKKKEMGPLEMNVLELNPQGTGDCQW